jgi:hypothetical protein
LLVPVVNDRLPRRLLLTPALARHFHVAGLLILVLLLNALDLSCTLFAYRSGLLVETNPLASLVIDSARGLILFKILMAGAGCLMLWRLRNHRWTVPACWILIAAYALLGLMWYSWSKDAAMYFKAELNLGARHLIEY